ncbi:TPA: hypothetical protein ACX6R8_001149 [Photobacterium damselae]|uniref:hypothetical protein n=1 Tax=Photobacterium damselae TaxID=38293 RepID=UPI000D05F1B5|nr:hypothetical protein [Photobacterium damselae]PSB85070.1 hypothetical protein C5F63_15260 [Photobacterium damselae subsp. damselae]
MEVGQVTNYKALIITGIISLAVAIGGNLAVNWLSSEKMSLSYDLSTSETFSSSSGNIKISTLKVENTGSKSVDEVVLSLNMTTGEIKEFKVSGMPANLYSISSKNTQVVMQSKYLNAGDSFSIQLLTQATEQKDFLPSVDLRGRGVIGKLVEKGKGNSFFDTITTSIAAIGVFSAFIATRQRTNSPLVSDINGKHHGEQRDVVAYILGVNGLNMYANEVRMLPRDISYWSLADYLCEKWIDSGDKDVQLKGAASLLELIGYARIAKESVTLIKTSVVRLSQESGSLSDSDPILLELQSSKSDVVQQRLAKLGVLKLT